MSEEKKISRDQVGKGEHILATAGDRSSSVTQRIEMRELTVLFSDIVGITPYFDKYGDMAGTRKIRIHNELLFPVIKRHQGRVIKTIGDAIMASFEQPEPGVEAAIEMQRTLRDYNRNRGSDDDKIRIRIGLHRGPSILEADDVFGDAVNVAARIGSTASSEQILISSDIRDELTSIRDRTAYHSSPVLKGKSEAQMLFAVAWQEQFTPAPAPTAEEDEKIQVSDKVQAGSAQPNPQSPSTTKLDLPAVQDAVPPLLTEPTQEVPVYREEMEVFPPVPVVNTPVDPMPAVKPPPLPPPLAPVSLDGPTTLFSNQPLQDRPTMAVDPAAADKRKARQKDASREIVLRPLLEANEPSLHPPLTYSGGRLKTLKAQRQRTLLVTGAIMLVVGIGIGVVISLAGRDQAGDSGADAQAQLGSMDPGSRDPIQLPDAGQPRSDAPTEISSVEAGGTIDAGVSGGGKPGDPGREVGLVLQPDKPATPEDPRSNPGVKPVAFNREAKELSHVEKALRETRSRKGIIPGDVPKLDALLAQISELKQRQRNAAALEAAQEALNVAESTKIDLEFISKKSDRFDKAYGGLKNLAPKTIDDLGKILEKYLASKDTKDYSGANKLLNKAFRLLNNAPR